MQDQRPGTRPRPIGSMGDLARTHGHRAILVAGIVLATVALLAGVGGAIRYFQGSTTQALTPDNVDRLTPAWTAEAGPGPVPGVATSADALFVSSTDGLLAYPLPCEPAKRVCAPVWSAPIPDGPLSTPTTNGTAVFAGSAQGRVYAFPAQCDTARCRPLWNGVAGNGPVSTPGENDDFVYVTSGKLYAFPATCGTNDRTCPPAWVGEIPGRGAAGRPAVGAGLVVVTSATEEGGVAAFPAVCLDPCKPVWVGETGGRATSVTLSQDTAYVVARGSLLAFPLSCRSTCRPSWTGTILPGRPATTGALGAPTVDGGQVYVGGADGTLWAFSEDCTQPTCPSTQTWPLGSLPLLTPVVQDGVVYVASTGGVLSAIPLGCEGASPGCGSPWSEPLGTSAGGSPDATSDGVYVGDDAGIVHAFTVPAKG